MTDTNTDAVVLSAGQHDSVDDGYCAVEWYSLNCPDRDSAETGHGMTDRDPHHSPVLAAFFRAWNDRMRRDEERTAHLVRYAGALDGTAGCPDADVAAGWLAVDWSVRALAPVWLRAGGLVDYAVRLEALPPLDADTDLDAMIRRLWAVTAAVRSAVWDDTPRDATTGGAIDVAAMAARSVVRSAGLVAAEAAVKEAAWGAGNRANDWAGTIRAATDAAAAALVTMPDEPTVEALQASAHDLAASMIALYPTPAVAS